MPEANNNIPSSPELAIKAPKPNSSTVRDNAEREEPLKIQEQSGTGNPCVLVRPGDSLWKIVMDKNVIAQFKDAGQGQLNPDQKIDFLIGLNKSLKENPSLIQSGQLIVLPENISKKLERSSNKESNPFDKLK